MQKVERALHRIAAWLLSLALFLLAVTAAYALWSGISWPEASGVNVFTKGSLTMDLSNAASGYVLARGEQTNKRLKLRVTKGDAVLTYDLNSNADYDVFPLQLGSGKYTFELYRNVDGKRYSAEGSISVTLELNNEYGAFLLPNQYVPYSKSSAAVQLSDEICAGCETDAQRLEAVRKYVVDNFTYDYAKAATITSGTMPSIDDLLTKRMGICQDIAAFTACVLRVQGIPTQMVIGYADRNYHAWNNVYIDGEWQRVDLTAEVNSIYRDVTYTVERYY